ncbi:hypothetical protein GQ600_13933 [Phytophthora cactorum]|nr:hypothetical protein GQ600_13933 [Phytophthora cactorum]
MTQQTCTNKLCGVGQVVHQWERERQQTANFRELHSRVQSLLSNYDTLHQICTWKFCSVHEVAGCEHERQPPEQLPAVQQLLAPQPTHKCAQEAQNWYQLAV